MAETCHADVDALYRLLRALASIGVREETTPKHFRLTPFGRPLRRDVAQSAWPAVVFWADLLADDWSLLTDSVRTGKPASQVRGPNVPSRWSQDPEADSIFRAVMGTAPAEDYAPTLFDVLRIYRLRNCCRARTENSISQIVGRNLVGSNGQAGSCERRRTLHDHAYQQRRIFPHTRTSSLRVDRRYSTMTYKPVFRIGNKE